VLGINDKTSNIPSCMDTTFTGGSVNLAVIFIVIHDDNGAGRCATEKCCHKIYHSQALPVLKFITGCSALFKENSLS
jgi:hypothetical protein